MRKILSTIHSLTMKAILATIFVTLLVEWASACVDGKDNLIGIYDLKEQTGKIRFSNVTIAIYGADKKPLCSKGNPLIQLPGYLKFVTGSVEVVEPIKFKKGELKIQFTSEHSSFFVGQVCLDGNSANAFVPDSMCERDFCKMLPEETCQLLTEKQVVSVHQLYDGYFELPKMGVAEVGGEWKTEAALAIRGNEIARIRVGKETQWIQIQLSEEKHEEL